MNENLFCLQIGPNMYHSTDAQNVTLIIKEGIYQLLKNDFETPFMLCQICHFHRLHGFVVIAILLFWACVKPYHFSICGSYYSYDVVFSSWQPYWGHAGFSCTWFSFLQPHTEDRKWNDNQPVPGDGQEAPIHLHMGLGPSYAYAIWVCKWNTSMSGYCVISAIAFNP